MPAAAATTAQKPKRPEPLQDESETDSDDFYSDEEYSDEDEDDYTDGEEEEQPQPQRQQRTSQKIQQGKNLPQQGLRDQPKKEEESPFAEGGSRAMQPFEHIGPPSTSMAGPVTYARAQRGEIPLREGNPNQKLQTAETNSKSIDDQDGLKLKLELNLDIEVELKASIHGDLTLALL
ncbi:hypothetical protein FQN54_005638 [Arachnomyces sp. PD_36]|nr:hypothetical protein FQN54_005638 [Arachnomyces sp. PD_36]